MTSAHKRFQAWRAVDLASSNHWIFDAEASLAEADPAKLRAWCQPLITELRNGSGVALVRGLGQLDGPALRQLYLAIGCCIGEVDTTYGALYDVTDSGGSYRLQAIPVSQTHASTSVHTDSSRRETHPRWVGLACIRQAPLGGGSRLVSVVAVHDQLAQVHPALLQRLKGSFHRDLITPGSCNDLAGIKANRFPSSATPAMAPPCATCVTGSKLATSASANPWSRLIAMPLMPLMPPLMIRNCDTTSPWRQGICFLSTTTRWPTIVSPTKMTPAPRG